MSGFFRKASLERLASPEQLDKMIRVTSPMVWVAALAVILVVAVTAVWAFFGELPTKVEAGGVYAGSTQTRIVYALSGGKATVVVEKDETVEIGQTLAVLDSSEADRNIADLEKHVDNISAITLFSENDVASKEADALLQLKAQWQDIGLSTTQFEIQLSELNVLKSEQESIVASSKSNYESAQQRYLQGLGDDSLNTATYKFNSASQELGAAKETLSVLQGTMSQYKEKYGEAILVSEDLDNDPILLELETQIVLLDQQIAEKQTQLDRLQETYSQAEQAYKNAYTSQASAQARTQELYNALTEKSQLYSTAMAKLDSIESQIINLKLQKVSDDISVEQHSEQLQEMFSLTKDATLTDLQSQLETMRKNRKDLTVEATVSGVVSQISVQDGQTIHTGSEVLRIRESAFSDETGEVICFIAVTDAKKFKVGMPATVTPSTVSEQEYGHINGTVLDVGLYNATTTEMQEILGDDLMVNSMQQQVGPAIKVTIKLNQDETSVNGYEWSNQRGAEIEITEGTIMSINVITERNAPITKLIPFLKDMLNVKMEEK